MSNQISDTITALVKNKSQDTIKTGINIGQAYLKFMLQVEGQAPEEYKYFDPAPADWNIQLGETWTFEVKLKPSKTGTNIFRNIVSAIEKVSPATYEQVVQNVANPPVPMATDARGRSIERQVSLKAAVEWVVATLSTGAEWTVPDILVIAQAFDNWIQGKEEE